MDSAKKSVEKVLEIAKKHGYSCVIGLKKGDDEEIGAVGGNKENGLEEAQAMINSKLFKQLTVEVKDGEE